MPGNAPPVATEREAISTYLRQQHDGIRFAAYGLTDEQAHLVSSRSAISIANLVKHVTHMERTWMERARAAAGDWSHGETGRSPGSVKDWNADGETIEDLMTAFDAVARATPRRPHWTSRSTWTSRSRCRETCRGSRRTSTRGRSAGCTSTSSRSWPGTRAMPTSSVSTSTGQRCTS